MDKFFYYDYLLSQANKRDAEILDLLKFELDQRIYYYGQHFINPREKYQDNIIKEHKKDYSLKNLIKIIMVKGLSKARYILKGLPKTKPILKDDFDESKKNILSNSYSHSSISLELCKLGYNVITPIWAGDCQPRNPVSPISFIQQTLSIVNKLYNGNFNELLSEPFKKEIEDYISVSKDIYKKYIDALIVPYDMPSMEKIAIKIFKEIKKPSFLFSHALMVRYNNIDENRTDYLIVWGEKIKQHYIDYGLFSADKIFVSGHPYYNELKVKELRFSLDNILVITKPLPGAQMHSDRLTLTDRGNIILYLFSLQSVLQKFGIKTVRFRPHPSENGSWYLKYIDSDFYRLDNESLSDSLNSSSLVIGPTTTVMLDAIYHGVNYIVYEPVINDVTLSGLHNVPPFDGTDNRLPVAKDEDELYNIIKDKIAIDISIWDDYIKAPFDISFIKKLV